MWPVKSYTKISYEVFCRFEPYWTFLEKQNQNEDYKIQMNDMKYPWYKEEKIICYSEKG